MRPLLYQAGGERASPSGGASFIRAGGPFSVIISEIVSFANRVGLLRGFFAIPDQIVLTGLVKELDQAGPCGEADPISRFGLGGQLHSIASRLSSLSLLDYSAQPVPDSEYPDLDPGERERLRNIIRSYRGEISLLELDGTDFDKAVQFVTAQDGKLILPFCGLLMIGKADSIESGHGLAVIAESWPLLFT